MKSMLHVVISRSWGAPAQEFSKESLVVTGDGDPGFLECLVIGFERRTEDGVDPSGKDAVAFNVVVHSCSS